MAAWATPNAIIHHPSQPPGLKRQVLRPRSFGPPPGGAHGRPGPSLLVTGSLGLGGQ